MTTWITSNFIMIILLALYVTVAYAIMWTRRWEAGFTRCMGVCRYLLHGVGFCCTLKLCHLFRPLYFARSEMQAQALPDFFQFCAF